MTQLPKWTPFLLATIERVPVSEEEVRATARSFNVSEEEVRRAYADLKNDVIYLNSRYQVNVRVRDELTHLSIKRHDKDRVGPERYRDFLRIKNELCGEDREAVELYPAMERNVDTAPLGPAGGRAVAVWV